jgi:mono/diheme cytochrome c family protein
MSIQRVLTGLAIWTAALTAMASEPKGPVCLWRFDGSLEDPAGAVADSLTPHEGTARFVEPAEVPGSAGKALALGVHSGDAGYLTAEASTEIRLGPDYTIEAWVLPTELGGWNRLVLRWGPGGEMAYHLAIHNGVASLCHNQAGGVYLFAEGGAIEPGKWHHLAGVARAGNPQGTLTVYVDGRATATTAFDGTIRNVAGERLGIGDSAGMPSPGSRFHGYLDELAIWNRALPAEEIAAHYAQRAGILRELARKQLQADLAKRAEVVGRLRRRGVEEIVFAERHPGRDLGGHYYANFGYWCTDPSRWLHGADGGSLCKLNLRSGELMRLVDDPAGAVRDPQLDFDARRIVFSYRKGGTHHYNLYEIGVDGSGLRQITSGDWDDVEPAWLPDDRIVFCSTRCKRYIGCWLAPSATLHRCDADGGNLRRLSSGSFTENTPSVLADGRVLYTRWEYVNRDPVSFHHLWTMGPDGTGQMVYLGNERPGGVFIDARPIPGGNQIVLINSPGHGRNEHAGHVCIGTPQSGPNGPGALKQVSREADFRDPFPVSDNTFLVACRNQLQLLDGEGRAEPIYTSAVWIHEPIAVVGRARPPVPAPRVDLASTTATIVLDDVYRGRRMAGVKRGEVKRLLVLEDLPKPANYHGGGSQPIGHGVTSTLKRILGTVPVEADGSAHFEVPAMRSVYFVLQDAQERSIKQMRSFVTLQPGETVGCVGCHEPRQETPAASRGSLFATARPASAIEPVADVPAILDFPRDVQPIFDRHCVACHNARQPDGGVVLVGDHGPVFSQSYYAMFLHWQIQDTSGPPRDGTGRQPGNDPPHATYSSASPLVAKLDGSHHDVRLSDHEARVIRLWIDTGATYPGTYAAYGTGQVGGCWNLNEPIRAMDDSWPSTRPAAEAVGRRCAGCHGRSLPQHVTDVVPTLSYGDMLSWERPLSRYSRHRLFNLSRPADSMILLAALARQSGGYAQGECGPETPVKEDRSRPPQPVVHPVVFSTASDPDYLAILAHIEAAKAKLDEIKRFDMPGFRPTEQYVHEMQRYGVLPPSIEPARSPIDVYRIDEAYWRSLWYRPAGHLRRNGDEPGT